MFSYTFFSILLLFFYHKTCVFIIFLYSIINHKHVLRKYFNYQEYTYCYLGYKNTMFELKLVEGKKEKPN